MQRARVWSGLVLWVLFGWLTSTEAQQKEMRKLRINVFRVDAAMVAAQVRGLFTAEGLGSRDDTDAQLDGANARFKSGKVRYSFDGLR